MSQRFQQAGGVAGPPQSPQQARYSQPMPQPSGPGPVNNMRYPAGPTQNFPVSENVFPGKHTYMLQEELYIVIFLRVQFLL